MVSYQFFNELGLFAVNSNLIPSVSPIAITTRKSCPTDIRMIGAHFPASPALLHIIEQIAK